MIARCIAIQTDGLEENSNVIEIASCDLDLKSLTPEDPIHTLVKPKGKLDTYCTNLTEADLSAAPSLDEALSKFSGAEIYAAHNFLYVRHYLKEFGTDWINTEYCGRKILGTKTTHDWRSVARELKLEGASDEGNYFDTQRLASFTASYLRTIVLNNAYPLKRLIEMSITNEEFPTSSVEPESDDNF